MKINPRWPAACFALLALAANGERTPPRVPALDDGANARVIVKFKADASALRAHALATRASPASTATVLEQRAGLLGARLGLRISALAAVGERTQVVRAEGMSAAALAARLAADAEVEYAEPDRRQRRLALPNDPLFDRGGASGPVAGQWYLKAPTGEVQSAINAVGAWDLTKGSPAIVVAVLDTGTRYDHPDLAGKLLPGYDMVSDSAIANDGDGRDADASDPGDWVSAAEAATPAFAGCAAASSSWHGTQIAGLIGAATDNAAGMAGAGWNLRVLPVRVLGKCFGYTSDIVAGMRWAAGLPVAGVPSNPNPARVINLSLGSDGACSQTEQDAISEITAAGTVVVVAAGNSAGLAAASPSNCVGAVGVAALRHVGTKVGFSDVGPELAIAAPGGNCVNVGPGDACLYPILTTLNSGATTPAASIYSDSFDISVGTSFSSPLVAATVGLMLSAQPALTPAAVRAALQSSARPFPQSGAADDPFSGPIVACRAPSGVEQLQCYCSTTTCGAGMLDAAAAVAAVSGLQARIVVSPAAPVAGQAITLTGGGSTVGAGRSIAAWRWTLVNGGGIASGFAGGNVTTAGATLTASGAGSVTVRLTITDDRGVSISADQAIAVAADPNSGGGGAMSTLWLLALAGTAVALRRDQRASTRRKTHANG